MERHCAMEYFSKLHMPAPVFHAAWEAADLRGDGRLDARAFCLFVQLLRGAQKGRAVPPRLSPEQAAALLGEGPMPGQGGAGGQPPLHIDAVRLRSVLQGQGHSRQASQASQEVAESVLHVSEPGSAPLLSRCSAAARCVPGWRQGRRCLAPLPPTQLLARARCCCHLDAAPVPLRKSAHLIFSHLPCTFFRTHAQPPTPPPLHGRLPRLIIYPPRACAGL
jgi:hypothetical protein